MFNFVATDLDGEVYAYENEPFFDLDSECWDWNGTGGTSKYLYTISNYNPDWAPYSLQRIVETDFL